MGDRYELSFKCPVCDHDIWCYYAESSGIDKVECLDCKKEFNELDNLEVMTRSEHRSFHLEGNQYARKK